MGESSNRLRQDYCNEAASFQSVPSFEQYHAKNPDISLDKINEGRAKTNYSCPDNYQMGTIQDNQIYIATTNEQHSIIASDEKFKDHQDKVSGPSGYFSDEATVNACKAGDALDNAKYNEMCQISPYRTNGIDGIGAAMYKPHLDCFEIDREALQRNYGTSDFNAAIAKCEANNHFGEGGGNQGYNPHLSEMIDNGTLKHVPEKSYSDTSLSHTEHNNPNTLINSVVPEEKADKMYADAQTRARDCVNNNTSHPSAEACNNGFPHNPKPIESNTGNAKISQNNSEQISGQEPQKPVQQEPVSEVAGQKPVQPQAAPEHIEPQIAGTTPDKKQEFDINSAKVNAASVSNLSDEASKAAGMDVSAGVGIT